MHAPVASWRLAAVLLSSSPGGARRARERGSKGEAFVTRQRYEHPLAGAAGRPVPRVHSHRTQRSTQGNGRARGHRCGHGTAARRAPPRAAGTSSFGSQGRSPAPGMRKAGHRPVPAGDERDRANLQPPDGGAAAGAPASTVVLQRRHPSRPFPRRPVQRTAHTPSTVRATSPRHSAQGAWMRARWHCRSAAPTKTHGQKNSISWTTSRAGRSRSWKPVAIFYPPRSLPGTDSSGPGSTAHVPFSGTVFTSIRLQALLAFRRPTSSQSWPIYSHLPVRAATS